uniref:PH domain-containing protein n=1 Tax=Macrostomum lignano TaxID=282301 RepID=A0A1I8FAT4_9PLAT
FTPVATDARERQYWVDRIRAVAQYFSEQCKILGSYNRSRCRRSTVAPAAPPRPVRPPPPPAPASLHRPPLQPRRRLHLQRWRHRMRRCRITRLCPPKRPRQRDQPTSLSDVNGSRGGRVAYPSPDGLLASLRDAITILDDLVTNLPPPSCTAAVEQSGGSVGAFSNEGSLYSGCASQADAGDQPDDSAEVLVYADGDGEGEGEEAYNIANEEAIDADGSLEVGEDAAASAVSDQEDLLIARGTAAGALRSLEACLNLLPYVRSQAAAGASSVSLAPARIAPASTAGLSGTATPAALSAGLHSALSHDSLSFAAIVPLVEMLENPAFPVPHQLDEPDNRSLMLPTPPTSLATHPRRSTNRSSCTCCSSSSWAWISPGLYCQLSSLNAAHCWKCSRDFMLHPDCLLRAAEQPDAESRITGGAAAKKAIQPPDWGNIPLFLANPIGQRGGNSDCLLTYTAEQVSHHPPITAFYMECPQKQLHLMQHDEVYNINLPSAYARSILTVPWVELGDKVTISCDKTKYNARRPAASGERRGSKNPASSVVCRVSGEWSGQLEFDYPDWPSQRRLIDVSLLTAAKKRVRPLSQQRPTSPEGFGLPSPRLYAPTIFKGHGGEAKANTVALSLGSKVTSSKNPELKPLQPRWRLAAAVPCRLVPRLPPAPAHLPLVLIFSSGWIPFASGVEPERRRFLAWAAGAVVAAARDRRRLRRLSPEARSQLRAESRLARRLSGQNASTRTTKFCLLLSPLLSAAEPASPPSAADCRRCSKADRAQPNPPFSRTGQALRNRATNRCDSPSPTKLAFEHLPTAGRRRMAVPAGLLLLVILSLGGREDSACGSWPPPDHRPAPSTATPGWPWTPAALRVAVSAGSKILGLLGRLASLAGTACLGVPRFAGTRQLDCLGVAACCYCRQPMLLLLRFC